LDGQCSGAFTALCRAGQHLLWPPNRPPARAPRTGGRHRRATARRAPSGPMRSRELTARGVRLNIGRSLERHHRLGRPWRAPLGPYHPALPGCRALAAAVTPRRRVWHT